MMVVSDTSCVSNLLTVGQAELLPRLFGEVISPSVKAAALVAVGESPRAGTGTE
jgi:predicted nucleic acid-binding protein